MRLCFTLEKINNVRFGGKETGRKNNLRWHSTIFHSKCSFSIHHPDHYDGSLFFQSPRLTSLCAPPPLQVSGIMGSAYSEVAGDIF